MPPSATGPAADGCAASEYGLSGVVVRSESLPLHAPASAATTPAAPLETDHLEGGPDHEARDAPSSKVPIRLRVLRARAPVDAPREWIVVRTFEGDDRPFLSVARRPGGYLLRAHGHADFLVDEGGEAVDCHPVEGAADATLEQLFVDHVLPQVLHLRRRFSFHASAVALDGRTAVGFLGRSGAGKSTLAASFGPRHAVLSDDCLAVSAGDAGAVAHPSYPAARLCRDAARALFGARAHELERVSPRTEKLRVEARSPEGPVPLARLYLIERGAADAPPALARVGRREAIGLLAAHLHRLDPEDRRLLAEELTFLDRIARMVPVARLEVPRAFERLPEVHALVAADLAGAPEASARLPEASADAPEQSARAPEASARAEAAKPGDRRSG